RRLGCRRDGAKASPFAPSALSSSLGRSDREGDARPVLAPLQQLDLSLLATALELDLRVDLFLLRMPDCERIFEGFLVRVVGGIDVTREVALDDRRRTLRSLPGVGDLGWRREAGRQRRTPRHSGGRARANPLAPPLSPVPALPTPHSPTYPPRPHTPTPPTRRSRSSPHTHESTASPHPSSAQFHIGRGTVPKPFDSTHTTAQPPLRPSTVGVCAWEEVCVCACVPD